MKLAAIRTHHAFAEQWVVCRHFLHLGNHRLARARTGSGCGLQVMQHRGVNTRLHVRRVVAAAALGKTLGKGALAFVLVPVKSRGENQALGSLEAQAVDVIDENRQGNQFLPAIRQAEFPGLLDCIHEVGAPHCQADDLGLGRLGLQQE